MLTFSSVGCFQERDPLEGPIPHLEARLSVLLSIVPLAIVNVLEDDTKFYRPSCRTATVSGFVATAYGHGVDVKDQTARKHGLISSLQVLGQFSGLLCPPASVVSAANSAARKAAGFILNSKNEDHSGVVGYGEVYIKHLVDLNLFMSK